MMKTHLQTKRFLALKIFLTKEFQRMTALFQHKSPMRVNHMCVYRIMKMKKDILGEKKSV